MIQTIVKKECDVIDEDIVAERAVRNWFAKFYSGDSNLQDEFKPGWSTDIDNKVSKVLAEQNPHRTIRKSADKMKTFQSTISRHLEKLGKINKPGAWVPYNSTKKNKTNKMEVAVLPLSMDKNKLLLGKLITRDDTSHVRKYYLKKTIGRCRSIISTMIRNYTW